ncbi:MAG: hypothetical protein MRZ35_03770 [Firmicutes bacterium]|nr:hypothetical protein [Bacillota bacterium]
MKKDEINKIKKEIKKPKKKNKVNYKWVITVTIIAFTLSIIFSALSDTLLKNATIIFSIFILVFFIILGVIFDIIGVAVTAADEKPFHSMSTRKMKIGLIATKLKKNADKVSSLCNDVIGDVCGILSGSAGAMIAANLTNKIETFIPITLIITGIVAALTIGGKALCKSYAISKSDIILYRVSNVLGLFYKKKNYK